MITTWANQAREAERLLRDRLAAIAPYLESESVNEVMINPVEDGSVRVFVEANGRMEEAPIKLAPIAVEAAIRAIMVLNDKATNYLMDARLPGLRVAAALPPVSIHGPMLVIRRHATKRFPLNTYKFLPADLASKESVQLRSQVRDNEQDEMECLAGRGGNGVGEFLRWAVASRKNLLLCGGTGSGKTTLLSSCLMEVDDEDRVITCEDTNELVVEKDNVVQLEANSSLGVSIRDLIKTCLRSRPDRIVVGEIRGGEAYDFLDAMNTGHGGSLCTLHADSAELALQRLESLIRMSPSASNLPLRDMRTQIASAIHYIVFQARVGGVRAPREIIALSGVRSDGSYQIRPVYLAAVAADAIHDERDGLAAASSERSSPLRVANG